MNITIIEATSPEHIGTATELFREYAASLEVDLCFQGFEEELSSLPGKYAPPAGGLFLALSGDGPLGCVALRPLPEPRTAELKRLYVRPRARGQQLGLSLVRRALARAVETGCRKVRLDTLPSMGTAQRLYRSLGFHETVPYTFNPVPGVTYMELDLPETPPKASPPA